LGQLVEFPLEGGGVVVAEVEPALARGAAADGEVTRGFRPGEAAQRAGESFESAFSRLQPVATTVVEKLRHAADSPDEIQVEFGVQLSADFGAVVARASGEANFKVTLTWKREPPGAGG
jgi:hypothetical protein